MVAQKYTKKEFTRLVKMLEAGKSVKQIATALNRTEAAIRSKIHRDELN